MICGTGLHCRRNNLILTTIQYITRESKKLDVWNISTALQYLQSLRCEGQDSGEDCV
jgi:hypothetical protein